MKQPVEAIAEGRPALELHDEAREDIVEALADLLVAALDQRAERSAS